MVCIRAFCFLFLALGLVPAALAGEAAFTAPGDRVYFFKDGEYVRHKLDKNEADEGYPKPINDENWPGLAPYAEQIDAAFTRQNRTYFFLSDGTYLKYDLVNDRLFEGYPRPLDDENWPGLGAYRDQIESAVAFDEIYTYFFLKNGQYILYRFDKTQVVEGYPRILDGSEWQGLLLPDKYLTAAVPWGAAKIFLFTSKQEYYRFDRSERVIEDAYPKSFNEANWKGVANWFNAKTEPKNRWDGKPVTSGAKVVFKLNRRLIGPVNTGPVSQVVDRYLTVDPNLSASATEFGKDTIFRLHTIEKAPEEGLAHNYPGVYQKVVIEAPNGQYLGVAEARGGLLVANRGRDDAEVFILDQTWEEQVALHIYRRRYQWANRADVPLVAGYVGTYFYSYGDKTYGSMNPTGGITAGTLLEMYLMD